MVALEQCLSCNLKQPVVSIDSVGFVHRSASTHSPCARSTSD